MNKKSLKRTVTQLVSTILITIMVISCIPTDTAEAAKKKDFLFSYRIDVLDVRKSGQLAVQVLSEADGKVHIYKTYTDEKAPDKEKVAKDGYHNTVAAKIESTAYGYGSFKMDKKYNIYIVFEDSWGRLYGPWKTSNWTPSYFPKGDGTVKNPYQIWTERHLLNVVKNVKSGTQYILMQDIDMDSTVDYGSLFGGQWSGYSDFYASFNGNNHTIRGLHGQLTSGIGESGQFHDLYLVDAYTTREALFCTGTNTGTIKGCAIAHSRIYSGSTNAAGAFVAYNCGTIKRCEVQNTWVTGNSDSGGIVGRNDLEGTIELCYAEASVEGLGNAGGIVGYVRGGTVDSCIANPSHLHAENKNHGGNGGIAGTVGENGFVTGNTSLYLPMFPDDMYGDGSVVGWVGTHAVNAANCTGNIGAVPYIPIPPMSEDEKETEKYAEKLALWPIYHGLQTVALGEIVHPIENYIAINVTNVISFAGLHVAYTRSFPNETELYNKAFPFKEKKISFAEKSRPGTVKISRAKQNKRSIVLKWKEVKNVDGYEIQTSDSKYGEFEHYTDVTDKCEYTINYLEEGKTYGVRVRAFRKVDGKKVYGAFSKAKYIPILA